MDVKKPQTNRNFNYRVIARAMTLWEAKTFLWFREESMKYNEEYMRYSLMYIFKFYFKFQLT